MIFKQIFCKHRWNKKAHQIRVEFWSDFDKYEPRIWNQRIFETVYICRLCNKVRIEREVR